MKFWNHYLASQMDTLQSLVATWSMWHTQELLLVLATLILVRFQALRDCYSLCNQWSHWIRPNCGRWQRYSEANHVRTIDIVPIPSGARNKGYRVFSGSSNYMQEALGGTLHSVSYSWEVCWRVLNSDNYTHNEVPRMSMLMKEGRLIGRR